MPAASHGRFVRILALALGTLAPTVVSQYQSFQLDPAPNSASQLSGPLDFDLGGGVNIRLSGWNEARAYSFGVQANIHASTRTPTATVSGLSPLSLIHI